MDAQDTKTLRILQTCKNLIAQGRLEEALEQLINLPEKRFQTRVLQFSGQYHSLKKEFQIGAITHGEWNVQRNRIEAGLLAFIDEATVDLATPEAAPLSRKGKSLLILWLMVFPLALGFWLIFKSGGKLNCTEASKKAIYIARFQQDDADGFSSSVTSALRNDLDGNQYLVERTDFQSLDNSNYHDDLQKNFFTEVCDTSGLFLSGLWDREERVFNCYIDLFRMTIRIPELKTDETIILNNPVGIQFSVREDARFLADFIVGLLMMYEGAAYRALEVFTRLERDTLILRDPVLKAQIAFNKANAFAMRGDKERAKRYYEIAVLEDNKLRKFAGENEKVAERIFGIMDSDLGLRSILVENIIQDSIFEQNQSKSYNNQQTERERLGIETVKEQLSSTASDSVSHAAVGFQETGLSNVKDSVERKNKGLEEEFSILDTILKKTVTDDSTRSSPKAPHLHSIKTMAVKDNIWLAENLNIEVSNSWCYNNDQANCEEYGRLYTWQAAREGCAALGEGWRLPYYEEWAGLAYIYGKIARSHLSLQKGGDSGFAALFGGWRSTNGTFGYLDITGYYWSGTEYDYNKNAAWSFNFSKNRLVQNFNHKGYGLSVRCIKTN